MATCPMCRKHFKTLEDEKPEDHGCPYCGYETEIPPVSEPTLETLWVVECNQCGFVYSADHEDGRFEEGQYSCPACEAEELQREVDRLRPFKEYTIFEKTDINNKWACINCDFIITDEVAPRYSDFKFCPSCGRKIA